MRRMRVWLFVASCFAGLAAVAQEPVSTAFTYQGFLQQAGSPANGVYDFEIELHLEETLSHQVGSTLSFSSIAIADGLFTFDLDFGPEFSGDATWLEIRTREVGAGAFATLTPRQRLRPTPNAQYSSLAGFSQESDTLDGIDSTDFVLVDGGTITGDLHIEGTLTADAIELPPLDTIAEPAVYFPARLICGADAESDDAVWSSLASGTFRLNVEGAGHDVAVSFVGVAGMGMPAVAQRIQDATRTVTGGLERVEWDIDHFALSSGDTTSASTIQALSTHGGGLPIDVSGGGANRWMDCIPSSAVVERASLNTGFYAGRLVRLDGDGLLDTRLMPELRTGTARNMQLIVDTADGPGTYILDVPVGFEGATRFRMFYVMAAIDFNGTNRYSNRRGLAEGKIGGAMLDTISQITDTTSQTLASSISIDWGPQTNVIESFVPLQVTSAVAMAITSMEAIGNQVRITMSVSNPSPPIGPWRATLSVTSLIAYR